MRRGVYCQPPTDFDLFGQPCAATELGEPRRDCVLREAAEETGWQIEPQRLIGACAAPLGTRCLKGVEVQQFNVGIICEIFGGRT